MALSSELTNRLSRRQLLLAMFMALGLQAVSQARAGDDDSGGDDHGDDDHGGDDNGGDDRGGNSAGGGSQSSNGPAENANYMRRKKLSVTSEFTSQEEQNNALRAVSSGRAKPMRTVLSRMRELFDAEVLNVKTVAAPNTIYDVKMIREDGKIGIVRVDAHNLMVLGVAGF